MTDNLEALAERADTQHALTMAGDLRGLYGDYPPTDLHDLTQLGPLYHTWQANNLADQLAWSQEQPQPDDEPTQRDESALYVRGGALPVVSAIAGAALVAVIALTVALHHRPAVTPVTPSSPPTTTTITATPPPVTSVTTVTPPPTPNDAAYDQNFLKDLSHHIGATSPDMIGWGHRTCQLARTTSLTGTQIETQIATESGYDHITAGWIAAAAIGQYPNCTTAAPTS
jgi:hypothetical protein